MDVHPERVPSDTRGDGVRALTPSGHRHTRRDADAAPPVTRLFLAVLLSLACSACGDLGRGSDDPGGTLPQPPGNGSGEEVLWVEDVHPVLVERCVQCHTASFSAMPLTRDPVADYASVSARVVPGAPEASALLLKGTGQVGHGGGRTLESPRDDTEIGILSSWILGGALP